MAEMVSINRVAGYPSPIVAGTHDDSDLPAAPDVPDGYLSHVEAAAIDLFDLGSTSPIWVATLARLIRPLCVGALMAIPTMGAASVGLVAFFSRERALAMAEASSAFLRGIPIEIVTMIGVLATGYGFARTLEKLRMNGK